MNKNPNIKKSALAEFSTLSGVILVVILLAFIASVAFYIYMAIPPAKNYAVVDDAGLLNQDERLSLEDYAADIASKKDIHVVIVTTDRKGSQYSNTESGSEQFAADQYKKYARISSFKDDSGILILIDTELRYAYIYTYGTVHASIVNSEVAHILQSTADMFRNERYADVFYSILEDIEDYNFRSTGLMLLYIAYFAVPLLIVFIVALIITRRKRSKMTVDHSTYMDQSKSRIIGDKDEFIRQTVSVTYASSSSGGGGGRSGGGGGGGRTGGAGMRF